MNNLGEILKDGYMVISEGKDCKHIETARGENYLYSPKNGTLIPFTIEREEPELQAIRNYDNWGAYNG